MNPNTVGYDMDSDTLASIRRDLERGEMSLEGIRLYFWQDLQNRAQESEDVYTDNSDFFDWFRSVDLSKFSSKDEDRKRLDDRLTESAREMILSMPYPIDMYLWSIAKPVKQALPF